jgi:hypothetical protein
VSRAPGGGFLSSAAPRLAAVLLGAASVAWAAVPLRPGGLAQATLIVSVIAVAAGALRLALADIPQPGDYFMLPAYLRAWVTFLAVLRAWPWEEIAVVGIVWLEVQHSARPWPTAALGAGLVGYLLATHLAESGADPGRVLRRQARLLTVGACLLALGAGFAQLPPAVPGAGAALLRVLAAAAVIAAAVLVLPG